MFTNKLRFVLACFVFLGLLLGTVDSVSARSASLGLQQPATRISSISAQTGDLITFSQFVTSDIFLSGPFGASNIYFSLPASWRLKPGAQLDLSMTVTFSQETQAASGIFQGPAGNITVTLNDVFIGIVPIESAGKIAFQLQIPPEALAVAKTDNGLHKLRFFLRSSGSCQFDANTLVAIHTSSSMTLPHESILPDTSLANFPSPIFQGDAIFAIPVLVVIPDHPSAVELQSAMTIAAGLGNISSSKLVMDLNTVSHLTTEQIMNNNLVLIGKAATLPISNQLKLSLPINGGNFSNSGGNVDDGIIQLVNSPWMDDKVVLVVSGNTDIATLKAAQAISTGLLRPNIYPNVAIVDAVKTTPIPLAPSTDQTLGDMGYSGKELIDIGVNYATYYFYIPPGKTVSEDAYFELQYGHSSLLQYDRSGVVVSVNGKPVGSVSLTEETARQAVNKIRFSIPPSAVLTGNNSLEVKVSLNPIDKCSSPDFEGVYANIWPELNLHLPLVQVAADPSANYDLISYPAPFAYTSTLDSTAFVLQRDNLDSWRDAFQVAVFLGNRSNGAVTTLSTFYADELPENVRSKYNFIVIGLPSQLPVLNEINTLLPAPFDFGKDIAAEPEMQVKYRLNPNAAVGYVELLASPWNGDNVVIVAVGSDTKGVNWAASHLIEPLSWKLAGNFAVINDQQVYTADTRLTVLTPGIVPTQAPILEIVPPVVGNPGTSTPYRPTWLLPAMVLSVMLIVVTIISVIYINWFRNRSGTPKTIVPEQKEE